MRTEGTTVSDAGSIEVIRSGSRGHFDHGWLDTYHTFSFGDYHDPARMGYRSLRVMNEDRVAPGNGFGRHPHRDMEIITYVLEGTLTHQDSLGNGGPIHSGEFQRITAGTGIHHSEQNGSQAEPVHLYQIWLFPERTGLTPGYEQKSFDAQDRQGRWQVVASKDAREGSMAIHQDATLSLARLAKSEKIAYELAGGRHAWVQVVRGRVSVQGIDLATGDGATFSGPFAPTFEATDEAEILLFDLA